MRLASKWLSSDGTTYLHPSTWDLEPQILGVAGIELVRLGQGEPILLVPGLAGGWRLLAPLGRRLAQRGFEAILCGLRGDSPFQSSPMRLDSLDDLAKDLDRIIDALRVERPVVLGVSFGGAVALQWAVTNPGRVGGLILQGVEARFRPNLGSTITRRVLERFPLPSDNRFLNQFFNLLHGCKPEPGPLVDFVVEQCWQTDQSVVVRRLSALESYDVSDALDVIEAPTLVLAGSRDAIVPARRQQALAAAISSARYVLLEGAGHIGFLTHGEEVVHHVERMLRSTPVSSSSS